jgi:hypothetical protein
MYEYDGIKMRIAFPSGGEEGIVHVHYDWDETDSTIKEAVDAWFQEQFGLEYFTDYTIGIVGPLGLSRRDHGDTLIIYLRDPEYYAMIKLAEA